MGELDAGLPIGQVNEPHVVDCCASECSVFIFRVDRELIGGFVERYLSDVGEGLSVPDVRRGDILARSIDCEYCKVNLERNLRRHIVNDLGEGHLLDDCDHSWPKKGPILGTEDIDGQVCD